MKKSITNLILMGKNRVVFKWQDHHREVVWMFLEIEKSLINKDYNSDKTILQPINRFNRSSNFGKTTSCLYNIDYEDIEEYI